MSDKLYTIGKIVNTHGLLGELRIFPETDFADERFANGSQLVFVDPKTNVQIPVTVNSAREHKKCLSLNLKGFNTSMRLRNTKVGC